MFRQYIILCLDNNINILYYIILNYNLIFTLIYIFDFISFNLFCICKLIFYFVLIRLYSKYDISIYFFQFIST